MAGSNAVEIETFVMRWAAEHVHPRAGRADLLQEVDRLACQLTRDAREHGISGTEIFGVLGDIDVYLMEKCTAAGPPTAS